MTQQKPTTQTCRLIAPADRENKSRELVEILVDQEIEKTDNGRILGIVDQMSSVHNVERPVTRLLIAGHSRGRRTVDDSSGTRDDPTRTVLLKATKSTLPTPDPEKFSC